MISGLWDGGLHQAPWGWTRSLFGILSLCPPPRSPLRISTSCLPLSLKKKKSQCEWSKGQKGRWDCKHRGRIEIISEAYRLWQTARFYSKCKEKPLVVFKKGNNMFWLTYFIHLFMIYLFIWERVSMSRGRDRGRRRERIPSRLCTHDPKIITWAETRSQMLNELSHPGTPLFLILFLLFFMGEWGSVRKRILSRLHA